MKKYLIWVVLIAIVGVRFTATQPSYKDGDYLRVTGQILNEPQVFDNAQYIRIANLSTYLPLNPEINYGDKVVLEGVVEKGKLKQTKLIEIYPSSSFLYMFRKKLISFYKASLPEPDASLVSGMVVGSKQAISNDFLAKLKKTGTAHVIVASGMNVTLVAGFLITIFTGIVTRKKALIISLVGIWIYVTISGLEAPLIRAAIMTTIGFTAQEFGRVNISIRSLFLTLFVMLIINPFWLIDIGFILSFVATLSLMLFSTIIYRKIVFVSGIFRQDLATTLAAQIGVAPIIFFVFGQFNIFSPIYNLLVLWTIPLITIIGFVSGVIGLLLPNIGRLIILLIYPLTKWFNFIVSLS